MGHRHPPIKHAQMHGATLIELMVGLLIGMLAAIAILATFAAAETRKRNSTGAAETEQTGLITFFTVATEIANAGSGIAAAAQELDGCPDTGDIRSTLRPVPVLITAGAKPETPDSFVVNHGVASTHAAPVAFTADAPAGSNYRARSPIGPAPNDMIVAVSLTGHCAATTATTVSAPDPGGVVEIAHTGAPDAYPATSVLLNMGPRNRVIRVRYDVVDATLRSLDLVNAGATPNPLASNVVNLKAQYGIDADDDGFLDTWVSATTSPWTPAGVLAAPAVMLARIKAVRLGMIVRSELPDREATRAFSWVLFDCVLEDKTQCPGRQSGSLPGGWRYRVYETVIPLRNQIWNH